MSQSLSDQFSQEWKSNVDTASSCINYRLFKNELCYENYLNNLSSNLRITYTRFRSHFRSRNFSKLPVVSGSYLNISLANRLCDKCDSVSIGDEFHYLLECNFFSDKRKSFVKKYFYNNPSTIKFCQLFNSSGRELINLCKFLFYISKHLWIIFLILYKLNAHVLLY